MPRTIPSLPHGLRIYAIGDVHGRFDLLQAMADKVAADIKHAPPTESVEVFLGDYVDRGPQSCDVLDWLLSAAPIADRRICLLGNHEDMMLGALSDQTVLANWLVNGGEATLASYGTTALPPAPDTRLTAIAEAIPLRHRTFLAGLPRRVEFGTYLFVHAGIDPRRPLNAQDPDDLIWIRSPFVNSNADFGRIVVHGHTPVGEPDFRENRINIDTGAVFSGKLTCLVLEGTQRRLLQTPPDAT